MLISDIGKRLESEGRINVCITVEKLADSSGNTNNSIYVVSGRGELQLAVLLENMRREGFEFSVAAPKVIYDHDPETNEKLEPYEHVIVDVAPEHRESVMEYLDNHGGELQTMEEFSKDIARLTYICPTRGLLGYESKLRSDTRGTGRLFRRYDSHKAMSKDVKNEIVYPLIATTSGKATNYGLQNLEPRTKRMYITPGDDVYEGMIVGETNKNYDMEGNPCKAKQITNVRSVNKDDTIVLRGAQNLILEEILTKIQSDELLEVTPKAIRLRKLHLTASQRKQLKKKGGIDDM